MTQTPSTAAIEAGQLPVPGAADGGVPPRESPLRVMIGLVVVWIVLVLVFEAHRMSNSYVQIGPTAGPFRATPGVDVTNLDARARLGLPVSMAWWGISPRQALDLVVKHVGYELDPDGANAQIPTKGRDIQLKDVSLAQAIHRLVDDPSLGFCVRNGHFLSVFQQKLSLERGAELPAKMDWTADLPLGVQPLVVSPSGQTDLSLVLTPGGAMAGGDPDRVSVELWHGEVWVAMTQLALDAAGRGSADATTAHSAIHIGLERMNGGAADAAARYRLQFHLAARPAERGESAATTATASLAPASTTVRLASNPSQSRLKPIRNR